VGPVAGERDSTIPRAFESGGEHIGYCVRHRCSDNGFLVLNLGLGEPLIRGCGSPTPRTPIDVLVNEFVWRILGLSVVPLKFLLAVRALAPEIPIGVERQFEFDVHPQPTVSK
jgi:hypothetical protein